jgi:uncharacterized protein YkwD
MSKARHLVALALACALATPPLWAADKASQRQELEQLARDLNERLGHPAAEVSGRHAAPPISAKDAAFGGPTHRSAISVEALVEAMNAQRAAYGMRPLRLNEQLSLAAGDRVNDMFAKHYFNHVSPDGVDPFTWADKRGYDYAAIGENLAVGYRTAEDVVDGWMHSPGHRANILKGDFDEIGIASEFGSPTQNYSGPLVVAIYGTR